jgi:DNA-directed RNA polymerase specialized sigma24 family protein
MRSLSSSANATFFLARQPASGQVDAPRTACDSLLRIDRRNRARGIGPRGCCRCDTGSSLSGVSQRVSAAGRQKLVDPTEVAYHKWDHERTRHIEEVSTLGDEILDFYQPDEDLKLEDIVPDIEVPTPEQSVEAKELQLLVRSLHAQMPREWRRPLLLHHVGGRPEARSQKPLSRPEMEVRRILERAREYLR